MGSDAFRTKWFNTFFGLANIGYKEIWMRGARNIKVRGWVMGLKRASRLHALILYDI